MLFSNMIKPESSKILFFPHCNACRCQFFCSENHFCSCWNIQGNIGRRVIASHPEPIAPVHHYTFGQFFNGSTCCLKHFFQNIFFELAFVSIRPDISYRTFAKFAMNNGRFPA